MRTTTVSDALRELAACCEGKDQPAASWWTRLRVLWDDLVAELPAERRAYWEREMDGLLRALRTEGPRRHGRAQTAPDRL